MSLALYGIDIVYLIRSNKKRGKRGQAFDLGVDIWDELKVPFLFTIPIPMAQVA